MQHTRKFGTVGGTQMKKVYLETPESVIKALKEGKEIKNEDEYNKYSYKLVDGFIVNTVGNNFIVGDDISNIDNHPYILEEEPFKIEVGQWYETRDHQKARCYNVDSGVCYFTIDHCTCFITDTKGIYWKGQKEDNLDIIGPWEE